MSKDENQPTSQENGKRNFDLEERLISFAVRVLNVAEALPNTRTGLHIANQLIRCGTSPASNYGEAQSAESRSDFIHKMKVCLKESRETRVRLMLIRRKPLLERREALSPLIAECNELIAIFVTSIATAERTSPVTLARDPC
jgi:four helix bundle protein